MQGLHIGGKIVPFQDLIPTHSGSEQQQAAIRFIIDWLSGREKFQLQTSGSTGAPKIIEADRALMEFSARSTIKRFGLGVDDHALILMNVRFIAGIMMIVRALEAGMELTVAEASGDPEIEAYSATFTALAPLQLQNLLERNADLSGFRCILVGGAPVGSDLRQLLRNAPPVIFETYGMTETLSHIAVRQIGGEHPEPYFRKIQDIELATDGDDCLRLRGAITKGNWLLTNDRVRLIDDERFEWIGRSDWTINSGGIKIQPEKLEERIRETAIKRGWKEKFIIHGYSHPTLGSCVILLFEGRLPEPEEIIRKLLQESLDKYEVPRKILSIPEFPYSQTNKIVRKEISLLLPPLSF